MKAGTPARCVFRIVIFAAMLTLEAPVAVSEPVTSAPDPQHGRVLAERLCSNCHLVSDSQTKAVADVPSFKEIANTPSQTEGSIIAKIVIPKHPMPVIPITKPELNDLSAYIMSLRDR